MNRRTFFAAIAGAVIAPFFGGVFGKEQIGGVFAKLKRDTRFLAHGGEISVIKPTPVPMPEMTIEQGSEMVREVIIPEFMRAITNNHLGIRDILNAP
jgi:hypothetical protein